MQIIHEVDHSWWKFIVYGKYEEKKGREIILVLAPILEDLVVSPIYNMKLQREILRWCMGATSKSLKGSHNPILENKSSCTSNPHPWIDCIASYQGRYAIPSNLNTDLCHSGHSLVTVHKLRQIYCPKYLDSLMDIDKKQ